MGSSDLGAGSDRRPTERADRYLIPAAQVPASLRARLVGHAEAVSPQPAATVVLARNAAGGPEVLLLRRPGRSSFAANAWVFPGGRVDLQDADAAHTMLGPTADEWGLRLDLPPREAAAYVAAALREAWEETGILLSEPRVDPDELREARARILADEAHLSPTLHAAGLRLDARGLAYIAHWITPLPESRRYDTRFFLAPVAERARCDLVGGELVEARWVPPGAAVESYAAGALRLLPPTVHTLRRLTGFTDVPQMVDSLRDAPVPTILPTMRLDPAGVVIEICE